MKEYEIASYSGWCWKPWKLIATVFPSIIETILHDNGHLIFLTMDLARDVTELQDYLKPSFKWKFVSLLLLANVCSKADLVAYSSSQQSLSSFAIPIAYHNKFLAAYVMKRLHLNDWLQCQSACKGAENCISYNFTRTWVNASLTAKG